jgi:hypothetical protein
MNAAGAVVAATLLRLPKAVTITAPMCPSAIRGQGEQRSPGLTRKG